MKENWERPRDTITLPLLGEISAEGLTTAALENLVWERCKKYLRNPQVGVFVKSFPGHRISAIGSVRHPGVFELSGPKMLVARSFCRHRFEKT